jgi:heme/copper-type cytochrome/quinol oxidase subunit 2
MSFSLADAIFWVAVACCLVAQLAIIHSVVISPARVPGSEPTSRSRRVAEIAWAVIPGFALAAVLLFTWRAMHATPGAGAPVASMLSFR